MTENADLLSHVQDVQQQLQSSEREKQAIRQQLIKGEDELCILEKEEQPRSNLVCDVCCVL